jgi:uncharacterized spore protein YtfJ
MDDVTTDETANQTALVADEEQPDGLARLLGPLDRLMDGLGVANVFGVPEEKDGVTVIPVAEITAGLGFGFGSGPMSVTVGAGGAKQDDPDTANASTEAAEGAAADGEESTDAGSELLGSVAPGDPEDPAANATGSLGEGGGGGGAGRARPVGFIRLDDDGARFVGIADESKLAIAGMALAGWSVVWISVAIGVVARAIAGRRTA